MDFDINLLGQFTQQALPIIILLVTGLLLMLLDSFKVYKSLIWVAGIGMLVSAAWAMITANAGSNIIFFGMLETGGIGPLVHLFLCISGIATLFFLPDYLERQDKPIHDVYALLVFAVLGMILMANANDLMMVFIGLETMSMCLYIFAALFKQDKRSNEAGLKYFLLGSFASAFLLFGIAIIYGLTAHTNYDSIAIAQTSFEEAELLFYTAAGFILIGFLFKVAAFPFHNWTPDVYEGAPTPLAGFMATGSKMAAFIALGVAIQKMGLIRFEDDVLVQYEKIATVVAICAFLTMIYGNIVAARQNNVKRMLAYSSIAHSGYALLGLCAGEAGFLSVIFYMFIYTLMNIGAFGMVGMAERDFEDTNMEHWRGLGLKSPYFAGALAIFLFSLAGIPPLAGFMAKYQVFISAIRADLVLLATVGILTSVIGAYYYIRLIVIMFFGNNESPKLNTRFATIPMIGIAVLVALILLFGIMPSLVIDPVDGAFGQVSSYAGR